MKNYYAKEKCSHEKRAYFTTKRENLMEEEILHSPTSFILKLNILSFKIIQKLN